MKYTINTTPAHLERTIQFFGLSANKPLKNLLNFGENILE